MTGRNTALIVVLVAGGLAATLALGPAGTPSAEGQSAAKYLGSQKCMMCHQDQHQAWQKMKHSKAWESLSAEQIASGKDEKTGRACVECHSTGFGKGGFESAEKTPALKGVGCEACHGAGSNHMMGMMQAAMLEGDEKKAAEEKAKGELVQDYNCVGCHNPHIDYGELYGEK